MPAEHISSQQILPPCVQRHMIFLCNFVGSVLACIGASRADALCRFKQLRFYDLQVGQRLGAAFAASKHAGISQIANDTPDAGMVPHFTCSRPIAEIV